MKFLVLRILKHSELGMFHAYRRSGREGSKQRAINFDSDVVQRVFPSCTSEDRIQMLLKYDTDNGVKKSLHTLKRQAKNWRFEGNCPVDDLYEFVEPGCLFCLQVDASSVPASGSWVVFPREDEIAQAVLADGSTGGLARAGMIALEAEEVPRILSLLSRARPDMFTKNGLEEGAMSNADELAEAGSTESLNTKRRLPPVPERLVAMLGDAGHNFVSAVADIIDNSISAGATEIDISFDPPNSGNGRWLAIRDNGKGMSATELDEAMRIGSETDYDSRSLGKYGYGLKGASWSQARAFTVATRQKGGPLVHLTWDKDKIADWQVDESPLEPWESAVVEPGEHGTTVLWKRMKAPTTAPSIKGVSPHVAEIQDLDRHLGLVFHRFLDGDAKGRAKVEIRINNIPVVSNGPVSHPLVQPYDVKTLKVPYEGGTADVRVQPYVLPSEEELKEHHGDAWQAATERIGYWGRRNETQGLFIYRNDRLIRWGGWHDMWATNDEKTKLARLIIDFDPILDEAFQINISKQTVQLPGYLQAQIKPLATEVRKASQAKYRRPRKPTLPKPPTSGSRGASPSNPDPNAPQPSPGPEAPSGGAVGPEAPPPSPTPQASKMSVRKVTTSKFAWKVTTGFTGERSLQVSGKVSPALADLAEAIEANPEAAEALVSFLDELDRLEVQATLIEDAAE